jgi:hypothetical protein
MAARQHCCSSLILTGILANLLVGVLPFLDLDSCILPLTLLLAIIPPAAAIAGREHLVKNSL